MTIIEVSDTTTQEISSAQSTVMSRRGIFLTTSDLLSVESTGNHFPDFEFEPKEAHELYGELFTHYFDRWLAEERRILRASQPPSTSVVLYLSQLWEGKRCSSGVFTRQTTGDLVATEDLNVAQILAFKLIIRG